MFPPDSVATPVVAQLRLRVAALEDQVRSLLSVIDVSVFDSSRVAELEAKVRRLEVQHFCARRELQPEGHYVYYPPDPPDGDLDIGHRVVLATPASPPVQPPVVLAQHLEPAPETPGDSEAARESEPSVQARRRATHRAYVECLEQLVATQADRDTSAPAAAPSLQARRQATHRAYVADYYASRRY